MSIYENLKKGLDAVRKKTDFVPQIALVLGSGLGDYGESADIVCAVNYSEIPGFPVSTVPGHRGRFLFGYINGIPLVIMQGRVHFYEGYTMQQVVMPIRLMRLMGAQVLILTNAVGAINTDYNTGDFMIIKDQISCFVESPLTGENIDELGPRFPDMSEIYNKELRDIIKGSAEALNINIHEGVYMQLKGPNFETPAEIKAYGRLGADVVGMSTACEAIAANHMGMKICGISCISNMAAGISRTPLSHEEVQAAANTAAPKFKQLLNKSISGIGRLL